jgi:UDP-glucose 4-epimerase|tara:strand:+ start:292 stop:1188 length:897 start_codon:yes stop_codon:yes gene_type:complete
MTVRPVIVTGAGGFIGSHLAERLISDGKEVRAIESNPRAVESHLAAIADHPRFTVDERDVMDIAPHDPVFAGAAILYHCAGVSHTVLDPDIYWVANVGTFGRSLEAARVNGIGKVIYPSSAAVYGDGQWPAREDQPLQPRSAYGLSKKMTEEMADCWYRWYRIGSIGFRIFNGYGPRAESIGAVGSFLNKIREGKPICVTGDGSQRRDFVHVRDITDAFVLAAESSIRYGVYNLGTGKPHRIADLAALMGAPVHFTPADQASPQDMWADISTLSRDLGFTPSVSLETGIAELLKTIVG